MNIFARPVVTVLLLATVVLALWAIRPVVVPVILAAVAVLVVYPFYERVMRRFRMSENVSALLVSFASLLFVLVPLTVVGIAVWSDFFDVYWKAYNMVHAVGLDNLSSSQLWRDIQAVLHEYRIDEQSFVRTAILPVLTAVNASVTRFFANFIGGLAHIVLGLFVFMVTFFFLLRDGKRFTNLLVRLSPLKETETRHMFQTFQLVVEALIIGNFFTAIAQGIIGGIGFWLFGLPAPIFWGSVMMVSSLFPFFGPGLVYGPATLFVYATSGRLDVALVYLAYNIFITSTVDNVIKPTIMGTHTNIHPLVMFLSLIAGISTWGVLGILYGPLIAALLLLAIDFYLEETKQRSLFAS